MIRKDALLLALHVLLHMLRHPDQPATSETMAGWGGTHSVVIRRTFAGLRRAGIVASEKGHGGGWRLARDPRTITVADIQRALVSEASAPSPQRPECLIEQAVEDALSDARAEAGLVLERRLGTWTLADLNEAVARLHAASPSITGDLS
jgi:DNA-binding IscR family transcriptional regulator